MPFIEIKDFNALTNNKPFCEQPIKKQEAHEKLVEMLRSDDYTRENLLYFLYHQKYYKRIVIDFSRQENNIPKKSKLKGTLEENAGAEMLFYCWKAAKIW